MQLPLRARRPGPRLAHVLVAAVVALAALLVATPAVVPHAHAEGAGSIDPYPPLHDRLSAGLHHACLVLDSGGVTCWGDGDQGALGYGNTNDIGDNETPAANPVNGGRVPLPGGVAVSRLSAGGGSVCVVTTDGRVACWGYNADGRLGYGNTTTIGDNETPAANAANGGFVKVTNAAGVTAVAVSAGSSSACAILSTGGLTCWGDGTNGVLGFGNLNKIGDNETPADNPVNGGLVPLPAGPGGAAGSSGCAPSTWGCRRPVHG